VDQHASPGVAHGEGGELVAKECAARGAAPVYDENAAGAGILERGPHQGIILEDPQGLDRAVEAATAAEVAQQRLGQLGIGVSIAQVGGLEAHRLAPRWRSIQATA
jgi:hypothetical protein